MKNKTSLVLIEMSIMLLAFSVIVTICLHAFVWSYNTSRFDKNRTEAVILLQNTAELIKHCRGELTAQGYLGESYNGEDYTVYYNEDWDIISENGAFRMEITPINSSNPFLGGYLVRISDSDDALLASTEVYYQQEDTEG